MRETLEVLRRTVADPLPSAPTQLLLPFEPPRHATRDDRLAMQSAAAGLHEARAAELFLRVARRRRNRSIRAAQVVFAPFRSTLYTYRLRTNGAARVKLHAAFREASEEVLLQAADLMLCRTRRARSSAPREAYDRFVRALPPEAFNLPGTRRAAPRARPGPGACRSLEESFARVNARYLDGRLTPPQLCWSPKRSRRILGSYHERSGRLIVSRLFDSPRVPLFVLDYLMYHELLHKVLGVGKRADGRRCLHGAEFRRLERRFDRLAEALHFLKRI